MLVNCASGLLMNLAWNDYTYFHGLSYNFNFFGKSMVSYKIHYDLCKHVSKHVFTEKAPRSFEKVNLCETLKL